MNIFRKKLPFTLRYEKWSKIMGGDGISGTIRTVPENYYVATVTSNKELEFSGIEAMTKNIDKKLVKKWFKNLVD